MKWSLAFLPEAKKDLKNLAGNQRVIVVKAIEKIRQNQVSVYEGGHGEPLGNKNGNDLIELLKIAGIRVVFKHIQTESEMLLIVIGARADDEMYDVADHRTEKYNL